MEGVEEEKEREGKERLGERKEVGWMEKRKKRREERCRLLPHRKLTRVTGKILREFENRSIDPPVRPFLWIFRLWEVCVVFRLSGIFFRSRQIVRGCQTLAPSKNDSNSSKRVTVQVLETSIFFAPLLFTARCKIIINSKREKSDIEMSI